MDADFSGPRRGADRAVLLAHGAGSDRNAKSLVALADGLAGAGVPSLRFDFPYRTADRRAPDRMPVLMNAAREAAADLAQRTKLPPDRIVVGGRSMGGRVYSMLVADEGEPLSALGLLLLGYPLHPAGKPEQRRVEHLNRITIPTLFVSGTRDALAGRRALTNAARRLRARVAFHWLETADHGYRPLKSSGRDLDSILNETTDVSVSWVLAL